MNGKLALPMFLFFPFFFFWSLSSFMASQDEKEMEFEFIFVGRDDDEEKFLEFYSKIPFLAMAHERRDEAMLLKQMFEVITIPCVVTIDADGSLINNRAHLHAVSAVATKASKQASGSSSFRTAGKMNPSISSSIPLVPSDSFHSSHPTFDQWSIHRSRRWIRIIAVFPGDGRP